MLEQNMYNHTQKKTLASKYEGKSEDNFASPAANLASKA